MHIYTFFLHQQNSKFKLANISRKIMEQEFSCNIYIYTVLVFPIKFPEILCSNLGLRVALTNCLLCILHPING